MSERKAGMRSTRVSWLWRNYEGRIYVPDHWLLRFSPCCEYHRMRVHIGPFIWRWWA